MALLIVFSMGYEIYGYVMKGREYQLSSQAETLVGKTNPLYAAKLTYKSDKSEFLYNEGYTPGNTETAGLTAGPKFSASFAEDPNDGHTITDPVYSTNLTIKPKFRVKAPEKQQNRMIYPLAGKQGAEVLTLKAGSVKEDIILEKVSGDTMKFEYELQLNESLEARMENDGSIGVYGLENSALLGNVSAGSEKDAELLKNARQNGEKNRLIFRMPAPFIKESGGRKSSATAWYELKNNVITLHAINLKQASYPLSIDPTVYVETAAKFMQGNNETNVDFDPTNELIQKSQTTGARIDGWVDSVDMSAGLWDHSIATAGGYIYRAGGRVDPTMPYLVGQQASTQATDSTTFAMNMPTSRPAGDLYIAIMGHNGTVTVTPPAGWTELADNDAGGGNTRELAAYYKIGTDQGGGNESASYTWTGSGAEQWTGVIMRIKGFDNANPIACTTVPTCLGRGSDGTAPYVPITLPTVTPNTDASLVIRAAAINEDDPSDYTWLPSGHTKVYAGTSLAGSATNNSVGLVTMTLDQPPLATVATGTATLAQDGILDGTYGAVSIPIRAATVTPGYQNTVEWAQFSTTSSDLQSPNPGAGTCNGWCTNSVYNLPGNRVGMSMVAYNGYLYALGGSTDGTAANATNTVWVAKLGANGEPQLWHPTGGTPAYWFVSTTTLPVANSYTAVAAYENRIYLVGGRNTAGTSINSVYYADLLPNGDLGAWSTTGMQDLTTPTARFGHSIHIYNDVMYLLGGNNNGTLRNTVYYSKLGSDGSMNTWTATNNFATGRTSFGGSFSAVWGAYIYLAGGCTALSGNYCSTIASDVQLASINADGSLSPWNSIATLSNQRIGYTFTAWQGGLYRLGGCNRQNTSTGVCYATHRSVEFGAVNPPGDASTVSNSEPSGTAPCSGGSPVNCDLPTAGDAAGQGGQMSSMVVVNNGYIYNIGGCVDPTGTCGSDMSGNVSYAALNSLGQMVAPANCPAPNTSYGLWCVDSTNRINGTNGLGAAASAVFNNVIYIAGGTDSANWQSNMYRVLLNADGSLSGAWQSQTFAAIGGGSARGYMYMFTRANPASAGSNPGNLYMLGGCSGTGGIGCSTYYTDTRKCNIQTDASLTGCTTTGQMQVDADNLTAGDQGLGLMAGTVYANRLYLVGGACASVGAAGNPCGSTYSANRKDTIYAMINGSNNIVDATSGLSTGTWKFATAQMSPVRRRAVAFGYNGYIYSLAGYSGSASLQDLLFAKINVSTGDLSPWDSSGVVVTPRWDLKAIVSNGYVYAIGGCAAGAAPSNCTGMQAEVQTFQLYNNDSGTPVSFAASANQFATDRMGASSTILNGRLYVAGGCISATDCTDATNSVQYATIDIYGNLGTWSAGGNLPADRAWGQLETVGGTLYYIGGQNDTATNEQSTVYYTSSITAGNPTWNGTAATNGLPGARTQFSASVWDNQIYVTGGLDGSAASTSTVYVSPNLPSGGNITTAWTTSTNSFSVNRNGHTTIAYANNLYVIGGYDGTNYLNDVQYATLGYKVGTIAQTGINVTGTGTSWTSSMIGSTLQYRDGEVATILTVPSGTTMTVSVSKNVTAGTGYTILDGSVSTWSYTTSLPEPIRQADGFAANGYMYLVGGRSSDGDCVPNVLQAPISANTTIATGNNPTGIGEWYETNVKYSGERYGNAVSYSGGKMYVTGGACEKWPTVTSMSTQSFNTDTTPHNVTMPSVVDPGDLLIVLFSNDGNATVTDPDGAGAWTQISTQTRGTNVRGSVWAIDAAGTEDGTNVNFATSAIEQASAIVYRIPAASWEGNIASVEAANVDPGGTTNAPNPPALNPTGWGTENTLWLTYAAGSEYASVTNYPAGTTNGLHIGSTGATATNRATTSTSRIESRAASVDPAAYAMPSTSNGVAFTIAIRPAAFAYTNTNRTVQSAVYSQPQVAAYSRLIDTDTDVFPTKWLLNGLDNSIGARWQLKYRSMHDTSDGALQQNPNEDCGTSATMPIMTTWGQETNYGDVTLGTPATYTALNGSGGNINCARYFFFSITIDASQTFGYPEDVNRGPTISDLSLYFTADPSKRLRHGKTFTGGQLQPLDTPFP